MLRSLRLHLTYANVVSTLCLFIVLGGSAYATHSHLTKSEDIMNGEVQNEDLAPNSVGTGKVIDNSLTGDDIKESGLGTVPNASRLADRPARSFVTGPGALHSNRLRDPRGDNAADEVLLKVPGFGDLRAACTSTGFAAVEFYNLSGAPLEVITHRGPNGVLANTTRTETIPKNDRGGYAGMENPAADSNDDARKVVYSIGRGSGDSHRLMTVWVLMAASRTSGDHCSFQAQATSFRPVERRRLP